MHLDMQLPLSPPPVPPAATQFAFLTWDAALGRRLCPLATFGSRAETPTAAPLTSRLVCVDPPRADCDAPLVNASEVRGAVALVVRGGCSFAQKARRVQASGAVAMILANNTREEPFAAFTMGESEEERLGSGQLEPITIPCVMMSLFDVRQLFKQFPPSVKTGVMQIEIMDFEKSEEARTILHECERQRQIAMQNQGDANGGAGLDNGGGGWGAIKRKTSSIMKLLEPQAMVSQPINPSENAALWQPQQVAAGVMDTGSVPISSPSAQDSPVLTSAMSARKEPTAGPFATSTISKAPLFAFVQWSTHADSYQHQYAPLADFGLAGNNTIYQGQLVRCDPILADEATLRNARELSDAIALVKRGACTFPTKLERIQRCDAVAAIVGNDDTSDPEAAFVMTVDQIRVDHVTIPSVMVSLAIFEQLVAEKVRFVRILCFSGEAAASFMANAGQSVSLMEIPMPIGTGARDKDDDEALLRFHEACRDGDHGACQRILDESCSDDSERRELVRMCDVNHLTALHHASAGGNEFILSLLIQLGAPVDAVDIAMQTPLHIACLHGHGSCVRGLVKAGATHLAAGNRCALTTKQNIGGSTPLHYAAAAGSTDCLEVLLTVNSRVDESGKYLFDGVSLADNDGATPLHIACRNANTDCAMYLIAANADLDAVDNSGCTPLHVCCEMVNDPEFEAASLHVIEKLVSAGASMHEHREVTSETGEHLDALLLDIVESKTLRRELEVMYLRHEAQRSQRESSDVERENAQLKSQLSELETQVKQVVAHNLASQVADEKRQRAFEAQQTQIEQLHVQMKTIIQVLHSHTGGSPSSSLPGTLSTASLSIPSQSSFSLLGGEKKRQLESSTTGSDGEENEEALAQEAALARDLGKKFCREQKLAIAEMYFEKSLELFPLPGVHRLLEQVRKLQHDATVSEQQHKSLKTCRAMNRTRAAQTMSKSKLIQQLRKTLSQSTNAPPRVLESIEREIHKLVALQEGSTEFEMARKWIEWLVMLPWGDPLSGLQNADFYLANRDIFQQVSLLEQEEQSRHLQRAARTIQKAFREHYSVQMLTRSIAATRIQSVFRRHFTRREYRRLLRNTDSVTRGGENRLRGAQSGSDDASWSAKHDEDVEASVDYSTTLDPAVRAKLRHSKTASVVVGAHFVPGSPDLNRSRVEGHAGSSSPFHVLQLVRSESNGSVLAVGGGVLPGPGHHRPPVYFVWSRWGDSTSSEPSQCSLSGPYELLGTAQQRYKRVFSEQLQKFVVIQPSSPPTFPPSASSSAIRQEAKAPSLQPKDMFQTHEWSARRDSSMSRFQLSTLSA
ncbi:hypothetical protein Gpo141_00007571 [Globisporangium polare]